MVRKNEAIRVSEDFRNILKTYAKDAIRAQPFDLISWSAAYFRCLVENDSPPIKARFEDMHDRERSLSKELLKTLVKQIGTGYFVDRLLLQKRWKGLGLPENDLLMHILRAQMDERETIHWLKLLATMVLSLDEETMKSMENICEILTNDAEGGPNGIPIWIFAICFQTIIQLHTNSKDKSHNINPSNISTENFRKSFLIEWKKFIKPHNNDSKKTIKFNNAFDAFQKSIDFDNLISILKENHLFEVNETIPLDKMDDFQKMHSIILRELGAPWYWIFDFVVHSSPERKSYNFIELAPGQVDNENEAVNDDTEGEDDDMNISGDNENAHKFIEYLKIHSIESNGMVYPHLFRNLDCPKVF